MLVESFKSFNFFTFLLSVSLDLITCRKSFWTYHWYTRRFIPFNFWKYFRFFFRTACVTFRYFCPRDWSSNYSACYWITQERTSHRFVRTEASTRRERGGIKYLTDRCYSTGSSTSLIVTHPQLKSPGTGTCNDWSA